jgi:hypothetical protein
MLVQPRWGSKEVEGVSKATQGRVYVSLEGVEPLGSRKRARVVGYSLCLRARHLVEKRMKLKSACCYLKQAYLLPESAI